MNEKEKALSEILNEYAGKMPKGYIVSIHLEHESGWINLVKSNYPGDADDEIELPDSADKTWIEQLNDAVISANDHYKGMGGCICHKCIKDNNLRGCFGLPLSSSMMILCPSCGNKRCPKASDHNLECSNSNEPGQAGSIYRMAQ